jgi:hypothetical protein
MHQQKDYAVVVRPGQELYDWTVIHADGRTVGGRAPNEPSAQRCGLFVVAALRALDRIGRRNF